MTVSEMRLLNLVDFLARRCAYRILKYNKKDWCKVYDKPYNLHQCMHHCDIKLYLDTHKDDKNRYMYGKYTKEDKLAPKLRKVKANKATEEWKKYNHLPVPTPKELIGEWNIKMDTWWGWLFKNVKVIGSLTIFEWPEMGIEESTSYFGRNIAFWFFHWGDFDIRENGTLYYRNRRIVDWLVYFSINECASKKVNKLKGLYIKDGKPRCTFIMTRIT